jgi:tetrapyrrole methylase family protein / MazG family protein
VTGRVVVAGLGPAGPDLVPRATLAAVEGASRVFLRTARHPAAAPFVAGAASFDPVYDAAPSLDAAYRSMADRLVAAAAAGGDVVYLVPGSPAVAERTVELLRAEPGLALSTIPAPSFLDLAWDRLGVDPVRAGVRLVDGQRFAEEAAGERGPLLVAQCDSAAVLSGVKLAADDSAGGPPPGPVTVLQRLGLADEAVFEVAWPDLDRAVRPDHLTTLWVPELAAPVGRELVAFEELVRTLRERCPWDREQTHQSLSRHLVEEAYETLDAIEGGDPDHLAEELGDVLFQVFFHARLAAEAGQFTVADVARGITDKLVRRHPHVFSDVEAATPAEVMANWEVIKGAEKGRASVMDGIPAALPGLLYALKVQRRAAAAGYADERQAPSGGTPVEDLGDQLFALVDRARRADADPEAALRRATAGFRDRFLAWEAGLR